MKNFHELKSLLDEKYYLYNRNAFIETDPISIPHQFNLKEDIEIAGFFAAILAWGQRPTIIRNANMIMDLMDQSPWAFITNHKNKDLKAFENFKHRTFNGEDCIFFIKSLKNIYKKYGSLENAFASGIKSGDENIENSLIKFREIFFSIEHPERTYKHVPDPLKNSACKRLCMYLRWMVRDDKASVDFGIWKKIKMSQLCLPLDVHTANSSRKLGLLKRSQDDWKAVLEITEVLKKLDANDPVKYDFALFNLSLVEKIK